MVVAWIYNSSDDVIHHLVERKVTNSGGWRTIAIIDEAAQANQFQEEVLINLDSSANLSTDASNGQLFRYVDTTVSGGIRYDYRIGAEDSSGNKTYSKRVDVLTIPETSQGSIYNLACYKSTYEDPATVIVTTTSGGGTTQEYKERPATIVAWDYTQPEKVHSYIIYRAIGDGPFKLHETYLAIDVRNNPAQDDFNLIQGFSIDAAGNPSLPNGAAFAILDTLVIKAKYYRYKVVAKHIDGHYSPFSDIVEFTVNL